jgi:superfamily II DNA or RNA helicase
MDTDRIPKDILLELIRNTEIQSHIPQQLIKTLYDTTKTVRFLYIAEYEEVKIAKTSRDKYDELQIKFAMNEISEKQWEIQVYHTHIKQQSHELIAGILNVYLANMDGFQSKLYAYISDYSQKSRNPLDLTNFIAELSEEITCLTNIINENIQDIRNDYDPKNTTILKIRNMGEIDIGDCSLQTENPKKTRTKPKEIFEKKDIKLYEYQFKHVEKLNKILENTHYALDLSPLGTGKTYSASKIFQMGQEQGKYRHIITISPPSVKTKWLEVNQLYGLNCQANLTYGDLIGKKFHQPKSGYLIRNDFKVSVIHKDGQLHLIDKTEFTTTQLFNQLVEEGLLLVIDEFHYLKNESSQTEAAEAMITNIYQESKNGGKSRVLLMSGSPIDKMQQTTRLFKTLGIMKHTMIVSRFHSAGIDEIIDYINKTFPQNPRLLPYQRENYYIRDSINSVLRRIGGDYWYGSADKCIIYVYKIFINVVKVKASSSMNLNEIQQSGVVLKKYNGYFVLNEEKNREKMEMAISELSKIENAQISHFSRNMGGGGGRTRNEVNDMMAQLVRTMTIIETAKIDTFARLTRQQLTENPQKKVVIGVNYSATLYDLENLLREFKPLVINGSTSIKRRQTILKQFQEPSTEHRLLIGNVSVISTGIDLDDKHGNFPRVCYVSPNYNTIHIYQLSHRFLRGLDTKSNAEIYMVYSNHTQERRILESLAVKSNIMKTVTIEQAEAGVVFPCDYETHYEELGNIVELINEKLDKNP